MSGYSTVYNWKFYLQPRYYNEPKLENTFMTWNFIYSQFNLRFKFILKFTDEKTYVKYIKKKNSHSREGQKYWKKKWRQLITMCKHSLIDLLLFFYSIAFVVKNHCVYYFVREKHKRKIIGNTAFFLHHSSRECCL